MEEPGTPRAADLWTGAEARISARVLHVESAAALGLAQRLGRITARQLGLALRPLDTLLGDLDLVEVTPDLTTTAAAGLAISQRLRGYDALHCAAGLSVASDRTVVATGDADLLAAWRRLGLTTANTHAAER